MKACDFSLAETDMQLQSATDLDGSVELDDLDRVVLWAIRSVAVGRADCPSLRRTFHDLYGPAADQILCGLLVMIRLLGARVADGLRLHMPGSNAVSRDELMILAALAGVQGQSSEEAGREADNALAQLLGDGRDTSLACAIRYVAELLSDRGRRLSTPELAAACAERLGIRTLH